MSPLIALLVGGYLLSTAVLADPGATLARVGPFVPPLAPFTVPGRVLLGDAPLWESWLAVVLMMAASYLLVRLGARAYGGALLRLGPKLSIRDLWRGSSVRAVDATRSRDGGVPSAGSNASGAVEFVSPRVT
jgi:ABC-2 type transport system permease protein